MLAIVTYALKRKFTDPSILINLIGLPLILILILGNALAPTFSTPSSASATSYKTTLVVADLDKTPASAALLAFVGTLGTTFTISAVSSTAAGDAALSSQSADVLLSVDKGFGALKAAGQSGKVRLSAVDSNIDHLRATQIALDTYSDAGRATQVATASSKAPPAYSVTSYSGTPSTSVSADPAAGISGITYYSVTMLILILIYGMATTMNFIKEEYDGPLGDRYLASPTTKFTLITSQVISGMLASLIQTVIMVLAAIVVFRADHGARPWNAVAIIAIAVLLFNSLGLLLGLVGRSRLWLDPLVSLLIPAMTFLGGGFVKLNFGGLENLAVNSIFQNALFREISGAAVHWMPLYVCLGVAFAALLMSARLISQPVAR